ncbi:MAG: type VI secretion system tube protein Hcp [Bryobacterales bacterium]|nr:type VI secretion system tube protein Hcp [Bryobacterales bacterium]
MPVYIKFEGGTPPIRGSAIKGKDKGWLALDSVSMSVSRRGTGNGFHGVGRESATPLSEIICTTSEQQAAADLFSAAAWGSGYARVTIEFWGREDGAPALTYKLEDVMVSSFQTGGGQPPSSQFTLNYTKIAYDMPGPKEGKSASLMQFDIDRALA